MSCIKKREEFSDKYSYITFSFGIIDYDGLSRLLTYHEYITLKGKIAEEKLWLQQSKQDCEGLGVNIDQINQYFKNHVWSTNSYNPVVSVHNLVCTRWLSDDVIDIVFDINNTMYTDTICFLCKPTRIMYPSAGLNDMCSIRNNGINISKVIVAVNVACDDNGTYYVSDEKQQGVHWALLALDSGFIMVIHLAGPSRAIYQIQLDQT